MDRVTIQMSATPQAGPPITPLARVMFEQNVTRTALAEATGINLADISRIAARGMDPGQDGAQKIAAVLRQTCATLGWPHYDQGDEVAA